MDNIDKVVQGITIGILIANFLLRTHRVEKTIQFTNECLSLLNAKALKQRTELVRSTSKELFSLLFKGYLVNNDKNTITCGRKLLALLRDSGEKAEEGQVTLQLAGLYACQAKYNEAKELYSNALSIMIETGERKGEASCYANLGTVYESLGEEAKAKEHNEKAIAISKEIGNINGEASCYASLGTVSPQTRVDIERIMDKESNCSCLYISYYEDAIFFWIIKADKPILFRQRNVNNCFLNKGKDRQVEEVFGNEIYRKFHFLPREQCEDRSWFSSSVTHPSRKSSEGGTVEAFRLVEEEEDENQQPDPTLAECYKMIIAPVVDLLDEAEIIIVPDRSLFKVPFAALEDESGKCLSENYRIRIVPSLTTLKLIQDSPTDYHSLTGALIVGDPDVGYVLYKGRLEWISRLPCAKEEAEMIGRLLGVQPLLEKQATKQEVLQRIHSVGLIHFAAHGNAERGEIVLSPQKPTDIRFPQEEHYLLRMTDISQKRLRAKLVVISCCHSAVGHIRAEGVVGIARAFLASGARSVLVALWAIDDSATKQFMIRFYGHLVRGESASESLHQAMKWMRSNGFSKVREWAPFMLIGDNVTFDFH